MTSGPARGVCHHASGERVQDSRARRRFFKKSQHMVGRNGKALAKGTGKSACIVHRPAQRRNPCLRVIGIDADKEGEERRVLLHRGPFDLPARGRVAMLMVRS